MTNLDSILISENQLTPHHGKARIKATSLAKDLDLSINGTSYVSPYLNYLVLTYCRECLPADLQVEPLILYNRYFWFMRFMRMYCKQHGKDVGLEQQAFQIVEQAMADVDWQIIAAIDQRTNEE